MKKKKLSDEKRKERIAQNKAKAAASNNNPPEELAVPQRKRPPTLHELRALPAIRDLSIHYSVVTIGDCIAALWEEQKLLCASSSTSLSREEKQQQKQVSEHVDKCISKVFRRASVQVHPDRYGDSFLQEFELLKEAYEILQHSRELYIERMVVVIRAWGIHKEDFLQKEHNGLVTEIFRKQQTEDSVHERFKAKKAQVNKHQKETAPVQATIEAEYWTRSPGWLDVYHIHAHTLQVEVGLKFRDLAAYGATCKAITLQAHECFDESIQLQQRVEGSRLESLIQKATNRGEEALRVTMTLESHTQWELRWYAELVVEERRVITSMTQGHVVDLTHPDVVKARREISVLKNLAKRQTAVLKSYKLQQRFTAEVLESQSWDIHRSLSKSRSVLAHLRNTLEILERNPDDCVELTELTRTLGETSRVKSELDDRIVTVQQRDTIKTFKKTVAKWIESGRAAEWLQNVKAKELGETQGNRLYQLLIEGKKANSLLVDAATLTMAATRRDLFSEKQCLVLSERAAEVEAETLKETERLIKEEQKAKQAEQMTLTMEQRAAKIGLQRGAYIIMQDIKNRPELNGQVGYYMGVAQCEEERYIIKLLGDGVPHKEVSLKKENFRLWDGGGWPAASSDYQDQHSVVENGLNDGDDDSVESVGQRATTPKKLETTTQQSIAQTTTPTTQPTAQTTTPTTQSTAQTNTPTTQSIDGRPPRTSTTVWIDQKLVSGFIGARGVHIKKLQADTRTKMHVAEKSVKGWAAVSVTVGAKADVERALDLIESFGVKKYTPSPTKATVETAIPARAATTNATPTESAPPKIETQPTPTKRVESKTNDASAVPTNNNTPRPPFSTSNPTFCSPMSFGLPNVVPTKPQLGVFDFLVNNKVCLKTSPKHFSQWLQSQDIETMEDLVEAANEEDFLVEMVSNGLKGFKKAAFKRAAQSATAMTPRTTTPPTITPGGGEQKVPGEVVPSELYCPISFILMKDPVLAADGFTYERSAIVAWFARNADKTVLSPMTQEPLSNLELTPNVVIRTMAMGFS